MAVAIGRQLLRCLAGGSGSGAGRGASRQATAGRGADGDRVYMGSEACGGEERDDEEEGEARSKGRGEARAPETIGAGRGHRCLCRDASRGPDHFASPFFPFFFLALD
jgi:hypothetical protein